MILAGGRSTRMGRDKALLPIGGRPLVAHVANRLRPQVAELVLNANRELARFDGLGLQRISDGDAREPGSAGEGPLAGIAAALAFAKNKGFQRVATVPVDAPSLPLDLVARLAEGGGDEIAVAGWNGGMEPLFALWPVEFETQVAAALTAGERAVHRLIAGLPHRIVPFVVEEGEASPFLNLNTPEDVDHFERSTSRSPSTL